MIITKKKNDIDYKWTFNILYVHFFFQTRNMRYLQFYLFCEWFNFKFIKTNSS